MTAELETVNDVQTRLKGVRTAMVTTPDERGTLSSRPVTIQKITADGDIWFLVDLSSDWVRPAGGGAINVAVIDDDETWVSFAGRAEVVSDPAKVDDLKDTFSDAFFDEASEPVALRAVTDRIEWWTAAGTMTQLFEIAKAKVTESKPDVGDSGTIEV